MIKRLAKELFKRFKIFFFTLLILCVFPLFFAAPLPDGGVIEEPAPVFFYDASKALEYAGDHWNDGVGLCAEFVSECLKAGGVQSWSASCTELLSQLRGEVGERNVHELLPDGNKVNISANAGMIAAGDPIFWYCPNCDACGHTGLCSGADERGYLLLYAHNSAKDGTKRIWYKAKCYMCGGEYSALLCVHLTDQ